MGLIILNYPYRHLVVLGTAKHFTRCLIVLLHQTFNVVSCILVLYHLVPSPSPSMHSPKYFSILILDHGRMYKIVDT